MRKTALILMAVMVILASFAFVRAEGMNETNQTLPYVEPEIMKAFNQNQTWVEVFVKYEGYIPVTFENEEEMLLYYRNITPSLFSYIPETEMRIIQVGLSVLLPSFSAKITKDGFNKLVNDSRVIRIGFIRQLGALENETEQENQSLPYVDPAIYQNFDSEGWVPVIVRTIDISNITINPDDSDEKRLQDILLRKSILSNFSDLIIADLPMSGLRSLEKGVGGFGAYVTRDVLDILANDSRIARIDYDFPTTGAINNSNVYANNTAQNQTETKQPDAVKPQSFFQRIINFFKSLFRWG